ncbi:hypothetical protein GCM10009533_71550 [Saccharopolyspora spinosporotrichia]|uniref:Uncharacterized protein n=1 Tax=Saccharopolyspora erythraea TaxID=1836 RepID=A0ABN1EFG8_SACER
MRISEPVHGDPSSACAQKPGLSLAPLSGWGGFEGLGIVDHGAVDDVRESSFEDVEGLEPAVAVGFAPGEVARASGCQ